MVAHPTPEPATLARLRAVRDAVLAVEVPELDELTDEEILDAARDLVRAVQETQRRARAAQEPTNARGGGDYGRAQTGGGQ